MLDEPKELPTKRPALADAVDLQQLATLISRGLAREILIRLDPDSLLDSADVGAMVRCCPEYVTQELAKTPGFPKAYRLTKRRGVGHPRWKRADIQSWIDSHANGATKRGGRPRNNLD
ncbi:AlpA family transcriptional regulator [Paucibacter sp. KBW04]|uniref:helix-turn-helix transcriptional regulator n=1 Tax=Paucibacter sp. KBW04 TaxID=2153361 RepID=UPI000F568182|nr:hypothetical protein [Paucibacter sp. KBW04]